MRFLTYASWLLLTRLLTIGSAGETSADQLWSEFKATRQALPGFHQEFEITRKVKTGYVDQVPATKSSLMFLKKDGASSRRAEPGIWSESSMATIFS